jgi:hypothetical protein
MVPLGRIAHSLPRFLTAASRCQVPDATNLAERAACELFTLGGSRIHDRELALFLGRFITVSIVANIGALLWLGRGRVLGISNLICAIRSSCDTFVAWRMYRRVTCVITLPKSCVESRLESGSGSA